MNIKNCPVLENTFQTFFPLGVQVAQTSVHFAHFQSQARQRGVFGWVEGVLCMYISLKGICKGRVKNRGWGWYSGQNETPSGQNETHLCKCSRIGGKKFNHKKICFILHLCHPGSTSSTSHVHLPAADICTSFIFKPIVLMPFTATAAAWLSILAEPAVVSQQHCCRHASTPFTRSLAYTRWQQQQQPAESDKATLLVTVPIG